MCLFYLCIFRLISIFLLFFSSILFPRGLDFNADFKQFIELDINESRAMLLEVHWSYVAEDGYVEVMTGGSYLDNKRAFEQPVEALNIPRLWKLSEYNDSLSIAMPEENKIVRELLRIVYIDNKNGRLTSLRLFFRYQGHFVELKYASFDNLYGVILSQHKITPVEYFYPINLQKK